MYSLSQIKASAGKIALTILMLLFVGAGIPSAVLAQETESDTTKTEQMEEPPAETSEAEVKDEKEQPVNEEKKGKKEKADKDDGKTFFEKLLFWKKNKPPQEISSWHRDVKNYLSAKEDEYYRYGYTQLETDEWIPVFFIRRFKMMQRQYEHTLIIQGQPSREPNIKGVEMGPYGMEVENQGFDVEMPKFASVARSQKAIDEQESVQLASIQLELYGFEEVYWLPDKRKDFRELSDTWNQEDVSQPNGNN